ncbi:protein of unknown function DUF1830 [Crinalium epipsammum PCC 9333]|uniref:Uncharacterized protein n=2 Tax=Crinalium TaxID=241421 RepID=K9W5B8_9CYAN|nr:protein of unknown function DUF1830 [Crinalium epipsammum PCC 9333]
MLFTSFLLFGCILSTDINLNYGAKFKMIVFNSDLPSPKKLCCFYTNPTQQVQIIKITNIPALSWEKTIFPEQGIVFEAAPEAKLEIHTNDCVTAILADVIYCQSLCVFDQSNLAQSNIYQT